MEKTEEGSTSQFSFFMGTVITPNLDYVYLGYYSR